MFPKLLPKDMHRLLPVKFRTAARRLVYTGLAVKKALDCPLVVTCLGHSRCLGWWIQTVLMSEPMWFCASSITAAQGRSRFETSTAEG